MAYVEKEGIGVPVALPTEGVDRNVFLLLSTAVFSSRPPHGGRG